ncbi:MAG: hypothetical protein WCQ99_15660, partial [Pseudomonadota bacterium]
MYCPNCELEIKGEEKNECPICNSPLVDSPFGGTHEELTGSDTELKLKELIKDIDEKVNQDLTDSSADDAFKLDDFKEEPSEKEFELSLDDLKSERITEPSEDEVFLLNEEPAGDTEKELQASDETELKGILSVEPDEKAFEFKNTAPSDETHDQLESEKYTPEKIITDTIPNELPPALDAKYSSMDFDDTVELDKPALKEAMTK